MSWTNAAFLAFISLFHLNSAYLLYPGSCPLCPGPNCIAPAHGIPVLKSASNFKLSIIRNGQKGQVELKGDQDFSGFVLRIYDPATLSTVGTFDSPLPQFMSYPRPCGDKASVGQYRPTKRFNFSAKSLVLPFTLPSNFSNTSRIAAFAQLIPDYDSYIMLNTQKNDSSIPTASCAIFPAINPNLSPVAIALGVFLVLFVLLAGGLANIPRMEQLRNNINTVLIGSKYASPFWYSDNVQAAGFWIRTITFDLFPTLCSATFGEIVSYAMFFTTQGLVFAVYMIQMKQKNVVDTEWCGRALGRLLQIDLALTLFLPTRKSLWNKIVGISFERCIKYHRIVARTTLIIVIAHGALWVDASSEGWRNIFTTKTNCTGYGNLWGVISGILFMIVFLGSCEWMRRKHYELFHLTHALAPIALGFACAHAPDTIWFIALPMLLQIADICIRVTQQCKSVKIISAVRMSGEVVQLEIQCPRIVKAIKDKGAAGIGSYAMIYCANASIAPGNLHPFTISGLKGDDIVTFHIKARGSGTWTKALFEAAAQSVSLTQIRLEGPYGLMGLHLNHYTTIAFVCGGVGITPAGRLLEIALDRDARQTMLPRLRRLVLVWSVQEGANFEWFSTIISRTKDMAQEVSQSTSTDQPIVAFQIDLRLYVTRAGNAESLAELGFAIGKTGSFMYMGDCGKPGLPPAPFTIGRPQLPQLMQEIDETSLPTEKELPGKGVAMLVCGPKSMAHEASVCAEEHGFHFHKEVFEF